jgi:hypothetical protein
VFRLREADFSDFRELLISLGSIKEEEAKRVERQENQYVSPSVPFVAGKKQILGTAGGAQGFARVIRIIHPSAFAGASVMKY